MMNDNVTPSSAALDVLTRVWGRGIRVCMMEFIKSATGN